jgi:hypothetical protein
MGRTRTQIRQLTTRQLGLPIITGTADSGGSTTTLKDALILGRFYNDELAGQFIRLTSGSPTEDDLRIKTNVQSTGIATFIPTIGSAPNSLTYEVTPFPADAMHDAIDHSLMKLYDSGTLVRKLWVYGVSNSPIYNADFSYWPSSTSVDGWTVATGSVAKVQSGARHLGEHALRMTSTNSTLTLDNDYRRWLQEFVGNTVTLRALVSSGASALFHSLNTAGTQNVLATHSGDGEYEVLSGDLSIAATEANWGLQLKNGSGTQDISLVWVEGGAQIHEYPFLSRLMPDGPENIYLQRMNVDPTNKKLTVSGADIKATGWGYQKYSGDAEDYELGLLTWRSGLPSAYLMKMVGSGPFTLPTADTGVVEVNEVESLLVAKLAASELLELSMRSSPRSYRQSLADDVGRLTRDINLLVEGVGSQADATSLSPDIIRFGGSGRGRIDAGGFRW